MRPRSIAVTVFVACLIAASAPVLTQQEPTAQGPPVPFEDPGACPFEGCVYREWTAKAAVRVRTERRLEAPVSYELRPGEKVTALTGIVVTLKAGRVQFREPRNLEGSPGPIHIEPGQTLYLLTYQGEGFTKAWFNGKLYTDVDTAEFYNGVCDIQPSRCAGKIIERSQTEWWVQVRSRVGTVGWTHEPEKFDGKNAIGGWQADVTLDDKGKPDSLTRLRLDVTSARILVWAVSAGRDAELTTEADLYFVDRYQRLAACYRRRGDEVRAREMEVKAGEHARHGGWDGPPYAAAMRMPRPSKWFTTDAVSQRRMGGPPDAA